MTSHYRNDLLILSQLRHAEQTERDELVRFKLRQCAEEMDVALRMFTLAPSGANLAKVQGLWANSVRVLGNVGANSHLTKYDPNAPLVPASSEPT